MLRTLLRRVLALMGLTWLALGAASVPAAEPAGRLVDVAWLRQQLGQVLLLDASVSAQHRAGHIPGAVSADLYRYGVFEPTREAMEQRMRSWGVSPGRKIVVYDRGGDMMAPRLFFDLHYHGVPAQDIFLLDGGLHQWRAQGGPVTQGPAPAPPPGSWRIGQVREEVRVRLPEFLAASGDRANHLLVDALEAVHYHGEQRFFDRAGHVPHAVSMPSSEFFNADKTFKSAEEIRRMARHLGLRAQHTLHSHCGGGVAAAVPWFALHMLAGHPKAKLYLESQNEWLRDDRGLPFWTYAAPQLQRQSAAVNGWNSPMQRMFNASRLAIIDPRPAEQHAQGHIPYSINLPADSLRPLLLQPEALAARLGAAGVDSAHQVVVVADQGLTPAAALGFLALEQLGHRKVSVLIDSLDEWGLQGFPLTKQPTTVGTPASPQDTAVPPATFRPAEAGSAPVPIIGTLQDSRGEYPKLLLAVGRTAPAAAPAAAPMVHLPADALLERNGTPRPAWALYKRLTEAGVPRLAEVVVFADDVAVAAQAYYILRLMGWPDVKVWLRD